MSEINPNIEIIGKYTATHDPILCRCKVCGTTWNIRPHDILTGQGCPNYRKHPDYVDPNRKTQEQFINELNIINPDIEVLGQYINANTKIEFRCKKCGHIWCGIPANVLRGSGCPNWRNHKK